MVEVSASLVYTCCIMSLHLIFDIISISTFFLFLSLRPLIKQFRTAYYDRVFCIIIADVVKLFSNTLRDLISAIKIVLYFCNLSIPAFTSAGNTLSYFLLHLSSFCMYLELFYTLFLAVFFYRLLVLRNADMHRPVLLFPVSEHIMTFVSTFSVQVFRMTSRFIFPILAIISRIYFVILFTANVMLLVACHIKLLQQNVKTRNATGGVLYHKKTQRKMARFFTIVMSACVIGWIPMTLSILLLALQVVLPTWLPSETIIGHFNYTLSSLSNLQLAIIVIPHVGRKVVIRSLVIRPVCRMMGIEYRPIHPDRRINNVVI